MGAWSCESFGNDEACDFIAVVVEHTDLSQLEHALDAVLEVGDGYLEAPEASQAIAAAEVIARLQGQWGVRDAYSKEIDAWVERNPIAPSAALALKAKRALARIISTPSELLELWQEDDDGAAWIKSVTELNQRISH